jgi:hypothetical protein
LGIGTFQVTDNSGVSYYASSLIPPFKYKITAPDNKVLLDTILTPNDDDVLTVHGPFVFTTTVNTHYRFAVQATRGDTYGFSSLRIQDLKLIQLDGDAYDPAADAFSGIKDLQSKPCNAVLMGDKIVLTAEESILKTTLVSLNGSILYKADVNNNTFSINKPSQIGVYFVTIQTATQNKVVKISVN